MPFSVFSLEIISCDVFFGFSVLLLIVITSCEIVMTLLYYIVLYVSTKTYNDFKSDFIRRKKNAAPVRG